MSLPSWERGLKCGITTLIERQEKSLPSWERGLKSTIARTRLCLAVVAPFVGAWIEILDEITMDALDTVAPFVGAWIEII